MKPAERQTDRVQTPELVAAAVAVEALREAAAQLNDPDSTPEVKSVADAVIYLYDRADLIEREAGKPDAER